MPSATQDFALYMYLCTCTFEEEMTGVQIRFWNGNGSRDLTANAFWLPKISEENYVMLYRLLKSI